MADAFRALAVLADPTRREIFERLRAGPKAVGEVARGLKVSRPAVSQHLKALKSAGLVTDHAEGTRRVYKIDPAGLGAIRAWLDRFWTDAMADFSREIASKVGEHGMNVMITPAPVRVSHRVEANPARAFEVFTSGMGRWWNKSHSIGSSPQADVVIEPEAGGRWFERGEDGSESEWGRVLVWEPPSRVVMAWQLDGDWRFDPAFVTELDIRFEADGDGTRVELEHRNLERYSDKAEAVRAAVMSPDGWPGLLRRYEEALAA